MTVQIDGTNGITGPSLNMGTVIGGTVTATSSMSAPAGTAIHQPITFEQLFTPINNTGAVADIILLPGQSCFVDATAANSIPLHVACGDNQLFEVFMVNKSRVAAGAGFYLFPNNINYGNVFTLREVYAAGTSAVASATGNAPAYVGINGGQLFFGRGHISTATAGKYWQVSSQESSATVLFAGTMNIEWQDVTTPWTSLGTFSIAVPWTGRITVKRVI